MGARMHKKTINVLIVDDSAIIREFLRTVLEAEPDIHVVATAADAFLARDKFLRYRPDVVTLDIEMPRMNGLDFLRKLMSAHPTPVVMFSSQTQHGAEATLKALALGAVDFVPKPLHNLRDHLDSLGNIMVEKVRIAAKAKVAPRRLSGIAPAVPPKFAVGQVVPLAPAPPRKGGPMVVLIGASTGGTVALEEVLGALPADSPPIAVVQHMPENFTDAFAKRLNENSLITIQEARNGQPLPPGVCLIAPGGKHLLLENSSKGYYVTVKDGPPVNRHKPSVDVLFRSGVNSAGPNVLAIIMTGMGDDGARALNELRQIGAYTVAQNKETCVVYGMPRAAIEIGAAERIAPLEHIAPLITNMWQNPARIAK